MSNANFVSLHQAIQTLQARVEVGVAPQRQGICAALAEILEVEMCLDSDDLFMDVHNWFEDWPERSGNYNFPVSHPTLQPLKAFYVAYDASSMWIGEYGAARCRLLSYIERRAHFAAYLN